MKSICNIIKSDLQSFYDLPFDVIQNPSQGSTEIVISPHNDFEELFNVKICIRQRIRLIVEIFPQRYSASMIEAINKVDAGKKAIFQQYVEQIRNKGAKIELYINNQLQDFLSEQIWKDYWSSFKIRATKIVNESITDEDEIQLIGEWSRLAIGLFLSLLDIEKEEDLYTEGRVYQVIQNKYERNPVNRELCLSVNGYNCKICGFNFEKKYGELGHGFIHVHHIKMISSYGGEHFLNPVKDMIPVCPNCHAMLHRRNPPYTPEELKEKLK